MPIIGTAPGLTESHECTKPNASYYPQGTVFRCEVCEQLWAVHLMADYREEWYEWQKYEGPVTPA